MTEQLITDGRTKRAKAQRESRRAHILRTALEDFAKHGYHQTFVSPILVGCPGPGGPRRSLEPARPEACFEAARLAASCN